MTPDIRKERETALYEAALRLIAKGVNPAAMKVQQIADEAGIGKGTVYEYFASKDEILQGMALYCFDTEIARIAVLMASHTRSVLSASSRVLPGRISPAIAAEWVMPEQPSVSTSASWMMPSLTLRVSLQQPCCGAHQPMPWDRPEISEIWYAFTHLPSSGIGAGP